MSSYVEVPAQNLSETALLSLVEEFCSREGTDYGMVEFTMEQKTASVLESIARGKAKIFFDREEQSVNILTVDRVPNS